MVSAGGWLGAPPLLITYLAPTLPSRTSEVCTEITNWLNPLGIRGVSGLRSVGLLRGDTKRFGDGDFFLPTKRNLNFNRED